MKKIIVLFLVLGFSLTHASVVTADTLGVEFIDPSGLNVVQNNSSWTMGYQFTLSQESVVTGLGFWDKGDGYGFTQVRLWDSSQNILLAADTNASVTTFDDGVQLGKWNFMDASLVLAAGTYVVASYSANPDYVYSWYLPSNLSTASYLTFDQDRYQSGSGYPASTHYVHEGFFGGNIMFAATEVPTPSSFAALIGMGVMGLIAVRRRRKQA